MEHTGVVGGGSVIKKSEKPGKVKKQEQSQGNGNKFVPFKENKLVDFFQLLHNIFALSVVISSECFASMVQ